MESAAIVTNNIICGTHLLYGASLTFAMFGRKKGVLDFSHQAYFMRMVEEISVNGKTRGDQLQTAHE